MGAVESALRITESNMQTDGIAAMQRICPQPMKEVKLTSTDAWQYFYLDLVLDATTKGDTEIEGGPLSLLEIVTNGVILDFGLLDEGDAGLSDRSYAVGMIGDIPIHVSRIAYKSATPGSAGNVYFYAPYTKDALAAL